MAQFTFTQQNLPEMLRMMAEYAEAQEDNYGYFKEIYKTGLAHDAIGNPVEMDFEEGGINSVTYETEY